MQLSDRSKSNGDEGLPPKPVTPSTPHASPTIAPTIPSNKALPREAVAENRDEIAPLHQTANPIRPREDSELVGVSRRDSKPFRNPPSGLRSGVGPRTEVPVELPNVSYWG
jgi:hypothetical protein